MTAALKRGPLPDLAEGALYGVAVRLPAKRPGTPLVWSKLELEEFEHVRDQRLFRCRSPLASIDAGKLLGQMQLRAAYIDANSNVVVPRADEVGERKKVGKVR